MNKRPQYHLPDFLTVPVGGSMMFVAQMVASPIQAAEVRFPAPRVQIVESATADTQRIALVREGVLQDDFPTLVTSAARIAIGANGLTRLKNFFRLQPGWDGRNSKPIDLRSVEVFSNFFAQTGFRPDRLGTYMSSRGNVVVNWLDHQGQLLELEFHPNGIDYFVERTGEEGSSGVESQDFGVLLDRVANPLVA